MSSAYKPRTSFSHGCARSLFSQARPGSRLVEQGHFCPLCPDRTAGNNLLGVALQVVEYSDTKFSDEQLREQFADNAKRVARQGRALWPALEVGLPQLLPCPSHVQHKNATFP